MAGLAILCPGQGNQSGAMFERLAGNPAAEQVLAAATPLFGTHPDDFAKAEEGGRLFDNSFAQPLIATAILAFWAALRDALPRPLAIAGYSAGELPAYACAGALGVTEALELVRCRAQLMDSAGAATGGLAGVRGVSRERVEALCREFGLEIAIVNGPDHFVLGGLAENVAALVAAGDRLALAKVKRLPVTVASHTVLMKSAAADFARQLDLSGLAAPVVPVLAGISGEVVRRRDRAVETLGLQVAQTVQWEYCLQTAVELGATVFLEIGPGTALTQMVREAFPQVQARSAEEFRTLAGVAAWVGRHL